MSPLAWISTTQTTIDRFNIAPLTQNSGIVSPRLQTRRKNGFTKIQGHHETNHHDTDWLNIRSSDISIQPALPLPHLPAIQITNLQTTTFSKLRIPPTLLSNPNLYINPRNPPQKSKLQWYFPGKTHSKSSPPNPNPNPPTKPTKCLSPSTTPASPHSSAASPLYPTSSPLPKPTHPKTPSPKRK